MHADSPRLRPTLFPRIMDRAGARKAGGYSFHGPIRTVVDYQVDAEGYIMRWRLIAPMSREEATALAQGVVEDEAAARE